ncbi:hypothetical protein BKA62DRAFT_668823 [Auriculariales sp. MPI-PUGE-AT-0066]|nr:hypothetical protein BKA62DRAFT_668823 [Auriculariales sp. MPI-PUGE-AT-0066]
MAGFCLSYRYLRWTNTLVTDLAPSLPAGFERHMLDTPSGQLELLYAAPAPSTLSNPAPMFFVHGGIGSAYVWLSTCNTSRNAVSHVTPYQCVVTAAAGRRKNADDDANRLPSPPNAPLPGASLDRISATYSNPAYGTLAFKVKGDGIMRATTPTWNGAASVLSLQHFSGNLFNATLPYNIRAIDEPELIYVETMHLQAEFEIVDGVVKGFGLWGGGLWGAGEGVESGKGSTAREKAEVWFDRNEWPWESEASISPQAAFEIAQ